MYSNHRGADYPDNQGNQGNHQQDYEIRVINCFLSLASALTVGSNVGKSGVGGKKLDAHLFALTS